MSINIRVLLTIFTIVLELVYGIEEGGELEFLLRIQGI